MVPQVYEINQLALWRPIGTKSFSIRPYSDGYSYKEKGIIKRSKPDRPVARFAKNYIKGRKKFSLGLFTYDTDITKVEKWLDEQAKKVPLKEIDGKFKTLEIFY